MQCCRVQPLCTSRWALGKRPSRAEETARPRWGDGPGAEEKATTTRGWSELQGQDGVDQTLGGAGLLVIKAGDGPGTVHRLRTLPFTKFRMNLRRHASLQFTRSFNNESDNREVPAVRR